MEEAGAAAAVAAAAAAAEAVMAADHRQESASIVVWAMRLNVQADVPTPGSATRRRNRTADRMRDWSAHAARAITYVTPITICAIIRASRARCTRTPTTCAPVMRRR